MAEEIVRGIKRASGWSIALGLLMIVLGFVAVMAPWEAGIAIVLIVGWTVILSGGGRSCSMRSALTAAAEQYWKHCWD